MKLVLNQEKKENILKNTNDWELKSWRMMLKN